MPFKKDENEIGALWVRAGANGEFLSGQVNGQDVICFKTKSNNPKAPAWRVMKSTPRDAADQRRGTAQQEDDF